MLKKMTKKDMVQINVRVPYEFVMRIHKVIKELKQKEPLEKWDLTRFVIKSINEFMEVNNG